MRIGLDHTCVIERFGGSALPTGEVLKTWTPGGTVDCRYIEEAERLANEVGGNQMWLQRRLLLPPGTDVASQDRITNIIDKLTQATLNTGPLEIRATLRRNSTLPRFMALELEQVE
jgi:hypothetical protein